MIDEKLIEELNRGYVCPANATPEWRAACEYGFDMSLVESSLAMTPEQRLEELQNALNLIMEIENSRPLNTPNGAGR